MTNARWGNIARWQNTDLEQVWCATRASKFWARRWATPISWLVISKVCWRNNAFLEQNSSRERHLECTVVPLALCKCRSNCQRSVTPEGAAPYVGAHEDGIWQCLFVLLKWDPAEDGREIANLPLVAEDFAFARTCPLGQSGRLFGDDSANGILTLQIGWWSSWKASQTPHHWSRGYRTSLMDSPRTRSPTCPAPARGWQHEAACRIEQRAQDNLLLRLPDSGMRSPGAGVVFTTCPTCWLAKMEPHVFRVLLLRRLHLPLPWILHSCLCGLPLVATTVQPVLGLGSWGGEAARLQGSRWQGVNRRDGARFGLGAVHRTPRDFLWWWRTPTLRRRSACH